MKNLLLFWLLLVFVMDSYSQPDPYPVPPTELGHLFYLQHSRNKNTVVYRLNVNPLNVDSKKPVECFWIRYSEQGQRQELSYIQRKFAYGLNYVQLKTTTYEMNFVSNKHFKMYLEQSGDGTYHVYTTIDRKRAILTHLFINIIGGSVLAPKVEYVDIFGIDAVTRLLVSQRVKI